MLLSLLLIIPIIGIFIISNVNAYSAEGGKTENFTNIKTIALVTASSNLILSLIIYIFFNLVLINFNLYKNIIIYNYFDIYLGVDGIIYIFCIINNYNNAYSIII